MAATRKRINASTHHPAEGVALESEFSLPHTPMIILPSLENSNSDGDDKKMPPSLVGDRRNIALLTFLYVLQVSTLQIILWMIYSISTMPIRILCLGDSSWTCRKHPFDTAQQKRQLQGPSHFHVGILAVQREVVMGTDS